METGYEKTGLKGTNENGESSEFRLPIWARNFNSKMYVFLLRLTILCSKALVIIFFLFS